MASVNSLPDDASTWQLNVPYQLNNLIVVLEFLKGQVRSKKRGVMTISSTMPCAYGYICGTTDIHGEELDVYVANEPDLTAPIFVIDQVCLGTKFFDEHKVMIGFADREAVIETYLSVFGDKKGKDRLGAITELSADQFAAWTHADDYSLSPVSKQQISDVTSTTVAGVMTSVPGDKPGLPTDDGGGIILELPSSKSGPKMQVSPIVGGGQNYTIHLYSPLMIDVWSNFVDMLTRTLYLATDKDVFHIRIASPGGSVALMGRIRSAITKTSAKVITYAQGGVASAATTVWAAGHERHISPAAYFMQHMSSQMLAGKTSDIAAKADFCMKYIQRSLTRLVEVGLYTPEDIDDMTSKNADIFISGREAMDRVGRKSQDIPTQMQEG